MATTENRGGDRPTAGQNNPYKISGSGGSGQSGKKAQKAMQLRPSGGGASGATKALTDQISQGGFVKSTAPAVANVSAGGNRAVTVGRGLPAVPITADTQNPEETIFSGSSLPGGLDMADLNLPAEPVGDPDLDSVIALYPVMRYWANQPDTPNATKEYVRYLGTLISRGPTRPV